jgi:hypothetical protein
VYASIDEYTSLELAVTFMTAVLVECEKLALLDEEDVEIMLEKIYRSFENAMGTFRQKEMLEIIKSMRVVFEYVSIRLILDLVPMLGASQLFRLNSPDTSSRPQEVRVWFGALLDTRSDKSQLYSLSDVDLRAKSTLNSW